MTSARHIGFDVDGVLADFVSECLPLVASAVGREFTDEDISCFDIAEALGVPPSVVSGAIRRLGEERRWERLPACPGAVSLLDRLLGDGHRVTVVTSRPAGLLPATRTWLEASGFPREVQVHSTDGGPKWRFLEAGGVRVDRFVEDNLEEALAMAERGIQVLLVDHPWNRHSGELPGTVRRIRDLSEVLSHL